MHEAMTRERGRLGDHGDPEATRGSDSASAQRCEPLRLGLSPRDPHIEDPVSNVGKGREGAGPCLAACRVPASLAGGNGTRLCRRASTTSWLVARVPRVRQMRSRTTLRQRRAEAQSHCPRHANEGPGAFPVRGRAQRATCVRETQGVEAAAGGSVRHSQVLNRHWKRPASRPCLLHDPSRVTRQSTMLVRSASLPEAPRPAAGVPSEQGPLPRDRSGRHRDPRTTLLSATARRDADGRAAAPRRKRERAGWLKSGPRAGASRPEPLAAETATRSAGFPTRHSLPLPLS